MRGTKGAQRTCADRSIIKAIRIENAGSITDRAGDKFIAVGSPIGITTVVDSLTAVKQFVYDEGTLTMSELCDALDADWCGYEDTRRMISAKAKFFGNNESISDGIARKVISALGEWNTGDNYLGKKWLFGNLIGYNEHHKFFGEHLRATPDGRMSGEPISFGIGQTGGRDRRGLTALLNSVAYCDPDAVLTGPSVTNLMIEKRLVSDEKYFENTVALFETYFRNGGTHFQLNYVSKEELLEAKKAPERHGHPRVRVSGFSDYFVNLNEALQDDVIARTTLS